MSVLNPTCPTGCASYLPDVSFDACNPQVSFGEIQNVFIAKADFPGFTDWEDPAEWATKLALAAGETGAIRQLNVTADLPAASAEEIIISLGRKIYSPATHTINLDIDDLSDENYEFARTTSCNLNFKVWFSTTSFQYGGNDGITAMLNLRPVIERGIKSLNKLSGTITWESQFSPERATNCLS